MWDVDTQKMEMRDITTATGNPTTFNRDIYSWTAVKWSEGYGELKRKKEARVESSCNLSKTSAVYVSKSIYTDRSASVKKTGLLKENRFELQNLQFMFDTFYHFITQRTLQKKDQKT